MTARYTHPGLTAAQRLTVQDAVEQLTGHRAARGESDLSMVFNSVERAVAAIVSDVCAAEGIINGAKVAAVEAAMRNEDDPAFTPWADTLKDALTGTTLAASNNTEPPS